MLSLFTQIHSNTTAKHSEKYTSPKKHLQLRFIATPNTSIQKQMEYTLYSEIYILYRIVLN